MILVFFNLSCLKFSVPPIIPTILEPLFDIGVTPHIKMAEYTIVK